MIFSYLVLLMIADFKQIHDTYIYRHTKPKIAHYQNTKLRIRCHMSHTHTHTYTITGKERERNAINKTIFKYELDFFK